MKKLVLILAILIAFAAPAVASDFSAGGQARFEAVSYEPPLGAEDRDYFDQRYRVAFTWKVNDNVTTQLRADFAEFQWGDGYRPEAGNDTVMVDRAWAKINQGALSLTVGQQAGGLGHGLIWSDQFQGVIAGVDLAPIAITLLYSKESEGGAATAAVPANASAGTPAGNVLTDDGANDDTDIYGAQVSFTNDMFSGGLIYAYWDNEPADADASGFGAFFTIPVANFTIKGAVAGFSGDTGTAGSDFDGTQFFLSAETALTEALKCELIFVWADDVDAADTQLTALQDDMMFHPLDFGGALAYNNYPHVYATNIFDIGGGGGGVVGIIGGVQYAATEALTFYGKLAYAEPNDDNTTTLDSAFFAIGSVDWVWVPSVTVSAGIAYYAPDFDTAALDDDASVMTTLQLTVAF